MSSKHQQRAQTVTESDPTQAGLDLVAAVNKLGEANGLTGTLTAKERQQTVHEARFNRAFVEAAAARYDAHASLVGGDFDTASMREGLAFVGAYEAAASAARTLARAIEDQILQKKADVSLEANAIYAYLRGMAATSRGDALRGDVSSLASLRKRGSRNKPKAQSATPAASEANGSQGSPVLANGK